MFVLYINYLFLALDMPTGLKATSASISIGFGVTESAANTFTQASVDLNLDPLNREVFVVTAINLDPLPPDCVAGTNTRVNTALTTTSGDGNGNVKSVQGKLYGYRARATADIYAALVQSEVLSA